MSGSWPMTIVTPMPARKPVVTGVESRSAIQPILSRPTTIRMAPTINASRMMFWV